MDTWATSSLTPQIAGAWEEQDNEAGGLFERVFPMDLRPQGHDIIRTWLFATMVRSHHEHGCVPWRNAALSGWVLDPDRKKMSKSKGNAVTPIALLEQYGTDAVRYWSASGRPGVDTAVDEGQMKVGRKLALKILNVSKFVLGFGEPTADASPTVALDRAMLARLAEVVDDCTTAFEAFDYARALERAESFFWWFCDDYVELVKTRAYGTHGQTGTESALVALRTALSVLQRLFAPFLPFVTDEVWRWWRPGSVHASQWPAAADVQLEGIDHTATIDPLGEVLAQVRRAKTEAKVSQRAVVERLVVHASAATRSSVEASAGDLRDAGSIVDISFVLGTVTSCEVTLAPPPAVPPAAPTA